MPNDAEIEAKFWKALRSDRTLMLGLDGVEDGHAQPMTAVLDGDEDRGPLYFFTTIDNGLVQGLREGSRAMVHFVAKGHDLFATLHGNLVADNDRAVIDRLWNPHVATWYEGGKEDRKLQLLRLDAERAQIWLDGSSLVAGVLRLIGKDPKQSYKDNVAEVQLN